MRRKNVKRYEMFWNNELENESRVRQTLKSEKIFWNTKGEKKREGDSKEIYSELTRRAKGICWVEVWQQQSLRCHLVQVWCFSIGLSIHTQITPSHLKVNTHDMAHFITYLISWLLAIKRLDFKHVYAIKG